MLKINNQCYCERGGVLLSSVFEFETMAINAFNKLDKINTIIHNTQGIQEDVIRYQMICEVMKDD